MENETEDKKNSAELLRSLPINDETFEKRLELALNVQDQQDDIPIEHHHISTGKFAIMTTSEQHNLPDTEWFYSDNGVRFLVTYCYIKDIGGFISTVRKQFKGLEKDDCLDIIHDALTYILQKDDLRFQTIPQLSSYLHKVVSSAALDAFRKSRMQKRTRYETIQESDLNEHDTYRYASVESTELASPIHFARFLSALNELVGSRWQTYRDEEIAYLYLRFLGFKLRDLQQEPYITQLKCTNPDELGKLARKMHSRLSRSQTSTDQ